MKTFLFLFVPLMIASSSLPLLLQCTEELPLLIVDYTSGPLGLSWAGYRVQRSPFVGGFGEPINYYGSVPQSLSSSVVSREMARLSSDLNTNLREQRAVKEQSSAAISQQQRRLQEMSKQMQEMSKSVNELANQISGAARELSDLMREQNTRSDIKAREMATIGQNMAEVARRAGSDDKCQNKTQNRI